MSIYEELSGANRLLFDVELEPLQGERFQPTGFADLGPAEYEAPDGTNKLLVESPQSMANRLEATCWDNHNERIRGELEGLPYVKAKLGEREDGHVTTNSLLEAHRINSEYIIGSSGSEEFRNKFMEEINFADNRPVDFKALYKALAKYDPNSLIHGAFLEEIAGRLKVSRKLSAFIEASGVQPVESGGTKFSRVEPGLREGEGNVPFPRTEYVAESMMAYFNLDLEGIRSYGFVEDYEPVGELLVLLGLWKIDEFFGSGLRLRTACDLQPKGGELSYSIKRPDGLSELPASEDVIDRIKELIGECSQAGIFVENPPKVVQAQS